MFSPKFALVLPLTLGLAGALGLQSLAQMLPPPPGAAPAPAVAGNATFDVASIRAHGADDQNQRWMSKPDGISTNNIPLQSLVAGAYNVKMDLVSGGPSWANEKGFDVEAKMLPSEDGKPVQLTEAQHQALLRSLLIERFHLKAHIETKTLPTYDLVVAKGGPKLKAAPPPAPQEEEGEHKGRGGMMMRPGHLEAKSFKMPNLANQLGYMVQRTVLDKTGLTGEYDFDLDYTPEELKAQSDAGGADNEAHPSIYTALQDQLGLKLVSTKGPVDTLVIDNAELPSAN